MPVPHSLSFPNFTCPININMTNIPNVEFIKERDYQFPHVPYPIQKDFMNLLYDTLEEKKIGIFESPTGTVRFSLYLSISPIKIF